MVKEKIIVVFVFGMLTSITALAQDITMQSGVFLRCSDMLFDSGGSDGNYGANENDTLTICPTNSTDYIQLEFSQFELGNGDILKIYNGDNADPAQLIGTYTGNTIPESFRSTAQNTSHCLTLVFISDSSDEAPGFAAEISCVDNDIYMNHPATSAAFVQCSGRLLDRGGLNDTYSSLFDETN